MGDRAVKFIAGWSPSPGRDADVGRNEMVQPIVNTNYNSPRESGRGVVPSLAWLRLEVRTRREEVRSGLLPAAEGGSDSCVVALDPDPPSVTPVPDTPKSFSE